ncbi:UNVERIFIED_ORG: hypothetical protein J2X79_000215 [Arthrobacter globiformis]|nr:hypothetical protein [Arthrobacter globiformis]
MTFNPDDYEWITPKAEDLWNITVTTGAPFDNHQEISIQPAAVDGDSFAPVPLPDLLAATRYLTGIMARAALTLREEHDELARTHGCSRHTESCRMYLVDVDLNRIADDRWGPMVGITVPAGKPAKEWLRKVRAAVATVLAADAAHPTAAQNAEWDGDDANTDQHPTETVIRSLDDQPQPSTTRKESTQP